MLGTREIRLKLTEVWHVPEIGGDLMLVSRLVVTEYLEEFDK